MDIRPIGSNVSASQVQPDADIPQAPVRQNAAPVEIAIAVTRPGAAPRLEQVAQAVKDINKSMQAHTQGVEFSIDTDSERIIVKVVDQQTKEVLRQMPSEEALEIAKALDRAKGLLIHQQA